MTIHESEATPGAAITKPEATSSEKFTSMVIREFSSLAGGIEMSPLQKRLAQHLFIKIDVTLKGLEAKRLKDNKGGSAIIWQNVNLPKLAIDAVHRVDLGLDALILNHVHPIPYWNSTAKKYDLDLRVGYVGQDYYRREMALFPPAAILYELVYTSDKFRPIKRSQTNQVDDYEFEITAPFDRGEIVGGFGYIIYDDPRMNVLVIVAEKDFLKSRSKAKANEFWNENPVEMRYKTLVHRVTSKLAIDPAKVNASYAAVEADESLAFERDIAEEILAEAHTEVLTEGEAVETSEEVDPKVDPETGEILEEKPPSQEALDLQHGQGEVATKQHRETRRPF